MIIGIEGPGGAGKSTMARTVAAEIGAVVIEGGAWYRTLTYEALQRKIDLHDTQALVALADSLVIFAKNTEDSTTQIWVGDEDVTDRLYSMTVDQSVALVAQQLTVRTAVEPKIVSAVRATGNAIIVGRHIRAVLPEAAVLRLIIDDQEVERRYRSRMGESDKSASGRNQRDAATARRLGVTSDGIVEVDVTAMDPAEQAETLRQFIKTARS